MSIKPFFLWVSFAGTPELVDKSVRDYRAALPEGTYVARTRVAEENGTRYALLELEVKFPSSDALPSEERNGSSCRSKAQMKLEAEMLGDRMLSLIPLSEEWYQLYVRRSWLLNKLTEDAPL